MNGENSNEEGERRSVVYPSGSVIAIDGVLGVGIVRQTCYESDEGVKVSIYSQDPFNPVDFVDTAIESTIKSTDSLGLIEAYEKPEDDLVRVSEDSIYLLQVSFCQYVDAYIPEESTG